jgi:ribosomal protein L11 methyltransferase
VDTINWTELTIFTPRQDIDDICNRLNDIGINGFVIEDPEEMLSFIRENEQSWDMVDEDVIETLNDPNIKIYISGTSQGKRMLDEIFKMLKAYESVSVKTEMIADEDWANNWKVFFKPFKLGKKLYIKPAWESILHDEGRIIVEIDPASSFGSGQHETTKMCLIALEEYLKGGERVLDVGSGSGILSVAAVLLGASEVVGTDIDENAVITSKATSLLNHTEDKTTFINADLTQGTLGVFDVVVANLFSNIIVRLLEQIRPRLKEGGLLISSGIITDGLYDVICAYEKYGIEVIEQRNIGEWHLVIGRCHG